MGTQYLTAQNALASGVLAKRWLDATSTTLGGGEPTGHADKGSFDGRFSNHVIHYGDKIYFIEPSGKVHESNLGGNWSQVHDNSSPSSGNVIGLFQFTRNNIPYIAAISQGTTSSLDVAELNLVTGVWSSVVNYSHIGSTFFSTDSQGGCVQIGNEVWITTALRSSPFPPAAVVYDLVGQSVSHFQAGDHGSEQTWWDPVKGPQGRVWWMATTSSSAYGLFSSNGASILNEDTVGYTGSPSTTHRRKTRFCSFIDPTSGDKIFFVTDNFSSNNATWKAYSVSGDSGSASLVDITSTVLPASLLASENRTENIWHVLVDCIDSPGTARVRLLLQTLGTAGGTSEIWEWNGKSALMTTTHSPGISGLWWPAEKTGGGQYFHGINMKQARMEFDGDTSRTNAMRFNVVIFDPNGPSSQDSTFEIRGKRPGDVYPTVRMPIINLLGANAEASINGSNQVVSLDNDTQSNGGQTFTVDLDFSDPLLSGVNQLDELELVAHVVA